MVLRSASHLMFFGTVSHLECHGGRRSSPGDTNVIYIVIMLYSSTYSIHNKYVNGNIIFTIFLVSTFSKLTYYMNEYEIVGI